jgi:hypothetical protein
VIGSDDAGVTGALVRLIGDVETLGGDPRAVLYGRGAVTWTHALTGFAGSLWNCWQKYIAREVAGITWEEFRADANGYNPSLTRTGNEMLADETYLLPENREFPDTGRMQPPIIWDRSCAALGNRRLRRRRAVGVGPGVILPWRSGPRTPLVDDDGQFRAD